MSLYEEHIKNITSMIEKPYNGKNIKLLKHNDTTLHFDIDSFPIKLITDFDNFCMAESVLNIFDLNRFNMSMALKNKAPTIIIEEISKIISINNSPEKVIFNDPFHIFQKIDEYSKVVVDYTKLEKAFAKFYEKKSTTNIKIPKGFLLNPMQVGQLIINEIKKVNRNKDFQHYIAPDKKEFTFILYIKLNDMTTMEMKLTLNPYTYPFIPPTLEYVKPAIKLPLLLSIMNLDILKLENWNPTIDLEYLISKLGEQLCNIGLDYIVETENDNKELDYLLITLSSLTKETNSDKPLLSIPVPKINTSKDSMNKYWKSGTGYGTSEAANWDIKTYIKEQELYNEKISSCLQKIMLLITADNMDIIIDSVLMKYIVKQLSGMTMMELENNKKLFDILTTFVGKPMSQGAINMIASNFKSIYEELVLFIKSTDINDEYILQVYCLADHYMSKYVEQKTIVIPKDFKDEYCIAMKQLQFGSSELPLNHRFIQHKTVKPNQKSVMRMLSEISSFKNNLPLNWESSIWIRVPKDNFNLFTFLISGPKDTPYENGLFEFHAYLPADYPNTVPEVLLHTTGNNGIRFNPNLYNTGKVCLSLLGTWQGTESEKWNPKTSTFLQVMVSIQSLILVEQPFFNEPGYERDMNTPKGKKLSDEYNEEKEPHTISLAMIDMIKNPPKGFEEVVKLHFKMKKEEIIAKTLIWEQNAIKHKNILTANRSTLILLLNSL
jgi:ubiquitin-protein ligase